MNKLRFYVYVLYHPVNTDEICYVGKGQRNRVRKHAQLGASHYNKILASYVKRNWGQPLRHEIVFRSNDEAEAFACECYLINTFGRIDDKTGTLANFTDGGEGFSGYTMTSEQIEKMRASKVGVPQSIESIVKRSLALSGYVKTPEHLTNNGLARRGQKRSIETRAAMSYAWTDERRAANAERMRQLNARKRNAIT